MGGDEVKAAERSLKFYKKSYPNTETPTNKRDKIGRGRRNVRLQLGSLWFSKTIDIYHKIKFVVVDHYNDCNDQPLQLPPQPL